MLETWNQKSKCQFIKSFLKPALKMRAADKRLGEGQDPAMKAPDVTADAPELTDGQTPSLLEQENPHKPYLTLWFLSFSSGAGRGLRNQAKRTKTQSRWACRISFWILLLSLIPF